MNLQVLVSTMHQTDHSLIDKMNIRSDAVIVNQCDRDSFDVFEYDGYQITWICTTERGVGKSRNRALLAATADIILFADDDVVYENDYARKVVSYFEQHPGISLATFNLTSLNPDRPETIVQKDYKLKTWNCLKFGAFRIAVKREVLLRKNVFFSLLFGGGAKYQAGEDNLFIVQFLQRGGKGAASRLHIGSVAQENSTWFTGYDAKYYKDRGALFSAMYRRKAKFMLLLFEIRRLDKQWVERLKHEFDGVAEYKK